MKFSANIVQLKRLFERYVKGNYELIEEIRI